MKKLLICIFFVIFSSTLLAESKEKVKQIYYCAEDFAIKMDSGNWYLIDKSELGESKFNHFLSISMTLLASGKKTGNVFPGNPIPNWCGINNIRPITILSITDES